MSTSKIKLPSPGQRVGVIDGPCQWAEDSPGIVLCHVTDRWGTHALVMMDSGKIKACHSLRTSPGIGWHLI